MERRRLEATDEEALKPLRRGWQETELATRGRSDPGKLASADRVRSESTLPIKWIAVRVQIGHGQRGQVRAPSFGSETCPTQNRKRPRTMRPVRIPIYNDPFLNLGFRPLALGLISFRRVSVALFLDGTEMFG
jgi:hypothetical protein